MRKELGIYHNQYIEVTAEYMRVATTGGKVNILFRNVIHEGEEITDHVWIKMQDVRNSKQINEIKLKKHGIYKIREEDSSSSFYMGKKKTSRRKPQNEIIFKGQYYCNILLML